MPCWRLPARTGWPLHDGLVASLLRKQTAILHGWQADIVDRTGTVFASTTPEREGQDLGDSPAFAMGQNRAFISAPFPKPEVGKVHLELSIPLRGAHGNTIAVLILEFDARRLLAITGDYHGLGATGETVLGMRQGDQVHFLTPLRFDPNLSEIEPAPADGERARPMIHATAGQSGSTHARDYRNVRVVAVHRPIEPTGWGVVVKQDEAEAFSGVARLRSTLLISLGMVLLLGYLIVPPLVRSFTRPLRELEEATRLVAAGDLSASVPIRHQDEVGRLAGSFNAMITRLKETQDDLERSNQELASFAYVISHDLRAPLRGITTLSEWLEEDLADELDADGREQMTLLRNRVRRMDGLIVGLLEYSRIGRTGNEDISVDVGALLAQVVDTVAPPDHISVTVHLPMPTLRADPLRLTQVFQNLIENAVKYHPGPQGKVEVTCRDAADTERPGDNWEFSVSDGGLGIDPRHHERIFEMFQSLHARDGTESTGIGLALVQKIVEDRGGEVWVESQGTRGKGTTFRFTWPKGGKGGSTR